MIKIVLTLIVFVLTILLATGKVAWVKKGNTPKKDNDAFMRKLFWFLSVIFGFMFFLNIYSFLYH